MPEPDNKPQTFDAGVAVGWAPEFERPARSMAHQNKLPIINEIEAWSGLCFYLDEQGWSVLETKRGQLDLRGAFRLQLQPKYAAGGKDPLISAMGKAARVLDMTAGWGTDALHIASGGRSVVAIERHPLVSLLLQQAAASSGDFAAPGQLSFYHLDSAADDFKQQLDEKLGTPADFELVYLDPMFADKSTKKAKSKKPMSIMQQLVPPPEPGNECALFANAMQIAQKRVVVKRALKAPYIDGQVPQGSIKSKLLRFDLYKP